MPATKILNLHMNFVARKRQREPKRVKFGHFEHYGTNGSVSPKG